VILVYTIIGMPLSGLFERLERHEPQTSILTDMTPRKHLILLFQALSVWFAFWLTFMPTAALLNRRGTQGRA
jgi:hypothetical protein